MTPNWYEHHILPTTPGTGCGLPRVARLRERMIPLAQGARWKSASAWG